MNTLVVREAFGLNGKDYARGDEITDAAEIEAVQASHAHHVVKGAHHVVEAADEPEQPAAE